MSTTTKTALVLSGGGVRGAYEAGVVHGIAEVLGHCPFHIFSGTSAGAINAVYLAANAHRPDMGVDRLVEAWADLELHRHLRVELFGWRRYVTNFIRRRQGMEPDRRALLDPTSLEKTIQDATDFDALHENIATGIVDALIVPALHVSTGVTHMFAELAPNAEFRASTDPGRLKVEQPITVDHVMASAAIPVLFPPRRVGPDLYYDGGLRFNTPMKPAIRCGAERMVVITPIRTPAGQTQSVKEPDLGFLMGKLLNDVLLDSVVYDLQVLERFNKLVDTLDEVLEPHEKQRIDEMLIETRRIPYRKIETLVFTPSVDIGRESAHYLANNWRTLRMDPVVRAALRLGLRGRSRDEADWASWILFDGGLAERIVEFGRKDALARRDEIEAFFG